MILLIVPLVQCLMFTYRSRGEWIYISRLPLLIFRVEFYIDVDQGYIPYLDHPSPNRLDTILSIHISVYTHTAIRHCCRIGCGPDCRGLRIWDRGGRCAQRAASGQLDRRTRRMGRRRLARFQSWSGGRTWSCRTGCLVGVRSSSNSFELFRKHIRRDRVSHPRVTLRLVVLTGSSLSDNDIIQAERSLYRVRHELVAKREEISRQNVTQESGNGGWMGRVFGSKADQGGSCPHGIRCEADVS